LFIISKAGILNPGHFKNVTFAIHLLSLFEEGAGTESRSISDGKASCPFPFKILLDSLIFHLFDCLIV